MNSDNKNQKKKDAKKKEPPTRHRPDEDADLADSSSSSRSTSTKASKARRNSDQYLSSIDNSAKQHARAAALRASSSGMYRTPASSTNRATLDVQAKTRGRTPTNSTIRSPPKRVTPVKTSNATKLQRLQEEVAAKERGRRSAASMTQRRPPVASLEQKSSSNSSLGSSLSAVKQLNRMETDIASKERARASRGSGARRSGTTPKTGASQKPKTSRLDRMEAEIAAKAKVGRASTALMKGNESKRKAHVAQKLQKTGISSATTPGAVSSNSIASDNKDSKATKKKDSQGAVTYAGAGMADKMKSESPTKNYQATDQKDKMDIDLSNGKMFVDDIDEENGNKKLAVAVAVQEDEDVFIPSAVEYDPDAKLPVYKNQRIRVYSILICTILIIIAACSLTVLTVLENNRIAANQIPTEAPTCLRCTSDFMEYIELEVGTQKLSDPTSPEYMAKEWIIHEDEMQLLPTDRNFIQRYLLAAFYFDTHQEGDWRSCNRQSTDPSKNETEDCDLKKVTVLKPAMQFSEFDAKRWLSSGHECQWAGITCDDSEQVRRLDLHGQNITGTLPISFARFPYVQTLSLQINNFYGSLPDEYGKLKHMIHIEMHSNQFTGTFPASWANIRNLQQLNIAQNKLTGQLPTAIGNFRTIKGLYLYKNMFSGSLPPEIANAASLSYVRLHKNEFTGTLPGEFGDMQLTELWLHDNDDMSGSIPSGFRKLSNSLTDIRLGRTGIGGTIPEFMYDMSQLWRLDLYENRLSGTISPNVTKLGNLQSLRLQFNELTGTIPPEMGSMTNLLNLVLEGNQLTGEVPASVCALKAEHSLSLLSTDCLNSTYDPNPLVACECCTVCCDASGFCDCLE